MEKFGFTLAKGGQSPFRHPELVSGSIPVEHCNSREVTLTEQTNIDRSRTEFGMTIKRQTGSHNSQARWFALSNEFGMTKRCAFTLAEVLITLGIIGVVAAMTLPTLITKYQKKQTVNQLKKAYSEISQAVQLAQVEHGLMETWDFANYPDALSRGTDFYENYLMKNMKVIKKCIPSSSECWADDIYTLDKVVTINSNLKNNNAKSVSFVTASGYSVFGWAHGSGTGGWFWVDLNGPKAKPNQIGRDIFAFVINWKPGTPGTSASKVGFYPAGLSIPNATREDLISNQNGVVPASDGSTYFLCKKGKNHSLAGGFCAGVIAIDSWEIKDDYPWN